MTQDSDGIDEAFEGAIRMAAIAGARLGAEIMRAREEQRRAAELRDQQTRHELAQRFSAEKAVAVAQLGRIYQADWWDRADALQIGQTYATAVAWAPEAPEALRAQQTMIDELRRRYDLDVEFADRAGVADQVAADIADWERRLATERSQEALHRMGTANTTDPDRREQAEAVLLAARAEEERLETELPRYDSAERREADSRSLVSQGIDTTVVSARAHADTGFAQPAAEATRGQGRQQQKRRTRPSLAPGVSRDNPGRGR